MSDYIDVAGKKLPTLLALTADEQAKGLQYAAWPPPVMSFVYATSRINKYWMHKVPSPLDIVFSNKGIITSICYGEPYSTRIIGDDNPSDLIVEFPLDTCKELGIKIGDSIKLECGEKSQMRIFALKNGFVF